MENITINNQQLQEILRQIQSNTNEHRLMMETSEVPEYNPEKLILKTTVEQLCNERRKIIEENTERPKTTRKRKNLTPRQIQYQEKRKTEIREEESLRKRMKDLESIGHFDKH